MIKYIIIILSVLATIIAQISLKKGMLVYGQVTSIGAIRWGDIFGNIYIWIGGASYVAAFALYLALLSRYELSRIYPVTTTLAFVMVVLISDNLFREAMTWDKILGIGFILLGITFLTQRM